MRTRQRSPVPAARAVCPDHSPTPSSTTPSAVSACEQPGSQPAMIEPVHFGSSMVSTRSTVCFSSVCSRPLGQLHNNLVDGSRRAQSEMHAAVVLRQIARTGYALRCPALVACEHFDARANAIAIAFRCPARSLIAIQCPCIRRDIVDQRSLCAQVHEERIDLAVVVVVGKARAARDGALAQHCARPPAKHPRNRPLPSPRKSVCSCGMR